MSDDVISPEGRALLGDLTVTAWGLCAGSEEVEEVLLYLHLGEVGFMIEPCYRVGRRWWAAQFLDQALVSPVDSDPRSDELTDALSYRLLLGEIDVLMAPARRPSRIVTRWTPPDGELQVDSSDDVIDLTETTTFDVYEAWWEKVQRDGDTSVSS